MKQQRVYIDTSVVGGCFDEEFAPWSNGLMRDFQLGNFTPVVSDIVAAEIEGKAPEEVQDKLEWLLDLNAEQLEAGDAVVELADAYLERDILTPKYYDDALHVASASVHAVEVPVHAVEVLVSWNFRHIVHFDKIRRFNALNQEFGYRTVEIRSPREVTNYGPDEKEDV